MTSRLDEGWKVNGAGKRFNHKFGFGRLDVGKMVEKALTWKNVGKQRTCYGASHDTKRYNRLPICLSVYLSVCLCLFFAPMSIQLPVAAFLRKTSILLIMLKCCS